jgi:hypothetical protein
MDDGRPYMWIRFIMENEMTIIVIPPLVEGFLPSIVVAPPLVQLSIVNQCHKKKKHQMMMRQLLEGDRVILFLLTSLTYTLSDVHCESSTRI